MMKTDAYDHVVFQHSTFSPAQYVAPCIAVIDEWNNNDYSAEWAEFRTLFPERPFCLLVPLQQGNTIDLL